MLVYFHIFVSCVCGRCTLVFCTYLHNWCHYSAVEIVRLFALAPGCMLWYGTHLYGLGMCMQVVALVFDV